MKRLLYGLCILAAASIGANAQQKRLSIGDIQGGTQPAPVVAPSYSAASTGSFIQDPGTSENLIPEFMVLEQLRYAFSTRRHPIPETAGENDTARIIYSKVTPHVNGDTIYIGETTTPFGVTFTDNRRRIYNGLVQFVPPIKSFEPALTQGSFTIDTVQFFLYNPSSAQTPSATGVNVYLFRLPNLQNVGRPNFTGIKYDLEDATNVVYFNNGNPIAQFSPSDVDAMISGNTVNVTTISLINEPTPYQVDVNETWGISIVKQDRFDTTQNLFMIGAHEWGTPRYNTYGGLIRFDPDYEVDTMETWWSSGLVRNVTQQRFPAYYREMQPTNQGGTGQGIRHNHRMILRGLFDGTIDTTATGVEPVSKEAGFALEQNMPNPVDDNTTIRFSVRETNNVTLRVINALGQIVAELQNGVLEPGTYQAPFNAAGLPQGTYFYTLTSGSHSTMRTLQVAH